MDDGFVDCYEDLQVSPNADQETIERVYRLLAKRYHPDNNGSGSIEEFELITRAYKILSQPETRAAYDASYPEKKSGRLKAYAQAAAGTSQSQDQEIRRQILSVLYIERRQSPENAGVGAWRLAQVLGWPDGVLDFHIWYLKEKHWVERTDNGGFAITASGVDEIERSGGIISDKERLLPEETGSSDTGEGILLLEDFSAGSPIDLERAAEELKRRVAANPRHVLAWALLSYLHSRLGQAELARQAAQEVLRIEPGFSVDQFAGTLKFKSEEGRARFREHLGKAFGR